jgi:SRSO17 transposase
MPVVAEIPDELEKALAPYRKHFGAPAFEHFKRYVFGLMVSENLTVEGISRVFLEAPHSSSLNRFLTWAIWEQEDVNLSRLEQLKQQGPLAGKGRLLVDDSLSHKTGEHIEGVGIFKDHSQGRYVLAHSIVTAEFEAPDGTHHPLGFRLYLKKDYCQRMGLTFKTKIELAMELVELAVSLGLEIECVLFDNWYASKDFMRFLKQHKLHWVTRLKGDRNIKIRGEYVQIQDFAAALPREAFKRMVVDKEPYWVFSKAVDLKGVGRVRILISHESRDLSDSAVYYATDNVHWDPKRILRTYARRWKIETFYRDSKQNLGLEDYQLRDLRAIKRHWCLVFLAYSLLVSGLWGTDVKRKEKPFPTLGEWILSATKTAFKGIVAWIITQWAQGRSAKEIADIAFSH